MWYFINTIVSIYHVRERLMNWSVLLKKEQCSLLLFPYHKITICSFLPQEYIQIIKEMGWLKQKIKLCLTKILFKR